MASANTPSEIPSSQEQGSTPDASIGTQKNNNGANTNFAWGHCKQVVKSEKPFCYVYTMRRLLGVVEFIGLSFIWLEKEEILSHVESYNACDEVEREFDEIERNEMQQQQKSGVPVPSSRKGKHDKGKQSFFPSATTPGTQPTIKSILQSKEIMEKCDIAIAKWMMDASVLFNAVNSAYLDAYNVSKTADALFKLFRDVVLFVGPENVVHIVTDNTTNYVAAGRLLESEFPKLYWSPCAAHYVNLMFQDIGKFQEVKKLCHKFQ
ncbi:hypothetical protein AHAS_Ahas11G0251000 [Arachis hypogaea]